MPIRSPRSSQAMGFVQLSPHNSHPDNGIPLGSVRSRPSNSRGDSSTMNDPSQEKAGPAFGGRRKHHGGLHRHGTDGSGEEAVSLNAMGRIYNKIIGFSVITRYLVYVLPVALLLALPLIFLPITGNGPYDKDHITVGDFTQDDVVHRGPSLFHLFLWIEISWLALWAGKVVARLLPPIFMFFCGVVSSGTRKYATVLRSLEIPLSLFFWGLASWLVFKFFFPNDDFSWVRNLKRVLLALYISSVVFLVEKFLVQLISISYHQRSFANRIKESKREVFLVGLMYDASRRLFPMYCPDFAEEDYIITDSIESLLNRGKKRRNRNSIAPMKIIGDVGRFGDKVTAAFGNIAHEITGKQVFNPNSAHSIVIQALEKVKSSEAMARRIWMSFVVEDKESLSVEDIVEVLGPDHREEAEECFAVIDDDQNGDISLDEMVRKVVQVGKERKAITHSMKDIGQALAVFDNILLFVVLVIIIFIFLACFQSSFITTLATAGTALLSLSFVFAVTTQEFLGSCIFLFVKHPYDVSDRVDITGSEKMQLTVDKISLLYTVFTRIDKMQVVQVPNIVLNNLWIENVTRSRAMKETITLNVSYDTSFEDLELLRLEMEKFIRLPENGRDFQNDVAVSVDGVGDLDKLVLNVTIKHKSNWHNEVVRSTRRSKFMCALALALKRIPIFAPGGGADPLGGPENPAYSVSVSDEFAASARTKAADGREAARMVPSKPPISGDGDAATEAFAAEQSAAAGFNAHSRAIDTIDDWGNDKTTLSSHDATIDRTRSNDLHSMRSVRRDLHTRESQRGRRKAGEGLTPSTSLSTHHASAAAAAYPAANEGLGPQLTVYPSRQRSFDVESQRGGGRQPAQQSDTAQAYGGYPPPPGAYGPSPIPEITTESPLGEPPQLAPPSASSSASARQRGAPSGVGRAPSGRSSEYSQQTRRGGT